VFPDIKFLSTVDVGLVDTFTVCRRVVSADYPSTFVLRRKELERVLRWLLSLPI
jgi:hypothetical protein